MSSESKTIQFIISAILSLCVPVYSSSFDSAQAAYHPYTKQNESIPPYNPRFPLASYPYVQKPDGCSGWNSPKQVPDKIARIDFTSACDQHDKCYYTLGSNFHKCNANFLADLRNACIKQSNSLFEQAVVLTPCISTVPVIFSLGVEAAARWARVHSDAQDRQKEYMKWVDEWRRQPRPKLRSDEIIGYSNASNATPWGEWTNVAICPQGSFASGYKQRVERPLGKKGDDTSLNAIALYCSSLLDTSGTWIIPDEGKWGEWSSPVYCNQMSPRQRGPITINYIRAFQLKVEPSQGKGDDTGANSIRFTCQSINMNEASQNHVIEADRHGAWGSWGRWEFPEGPALPEQGPVMFDQSYACGIAVKFEGSQGSEDDTAVNDARIYWCPL
jgi:hypothetical protein